LRGEWNDLVGSDEKVSLPGLHISLQNRIHYLEDLFHDCVLTHVVCAFTLELHKRELTENRICLTGAYKLFVCQPVAPLTE
jgi:hypothetical protein